MRAICLLTLALTLTGCATPSFQSSQPRTSEHGYSLSRSALLDQTSQTTTHLDSDRDILYMQEFGGGGIATGLLLGPLGVAANMAMINAQTESDAELLKDKIGIQPRQVFIERAQQKALKLNDGAEAKITPYLYVLKTNGEQMLIATALLIEQGEGKSKWTGKYMYQLPGKYSKQELARLDASQQQQLSADVSRGFDVLLDYITHEQPAMGERTITFKSDFLAPRLNFDLTGALISQNADVTWVRTYGGIFALRKSNFSLLN